MKVKQLSAIEDDLGRLVSQIMRDKHDTEWETILADYQKAQHNLFLIDLDNIDEDDAMEVQPLLVKINQLNDTIMNLIKPFHDNTSKQLNALKYGKKMKNSYQENMSPDDR